MTSTMLQWRLAHLVESCRSYIPLISYHLLFYINIGISYLCWLQHLIFTPWLLSHLSRHFAVSRRILNILGFPAHPGFSKSRKVVDSISASSSEERVTLHPTRATGFLQTQYTYLVEFQRTVREQNMFRFPALLLGPDRRVASISDWTLWDVSKGWLCIPATTIWRFGAWFRLLRSLET